MSTRLHTPSIDLTRFEGLYTKLNPEAVTPTQLRECKNFDFFKEYGSIAKMRGTKRVLSSVYAEGDGQVPWGAFYKSQDLAGILQRRSIIQAGTKLHEVNSDGSLTELKSGEPNGLSRTSAQLDRFLYITGQDPFLIGKKGKMLRYDGTNVRDWGVIQPGGEESVIEAFNDYNDWTTSNCAVADSSTIAFNGTALKVTKAGGGVTAYVEDLNRAPFAINDIIEDRATIYLYIPRDDYNALAGSGSAVSVYVGSNADLNTDFYRYDFQIGQLIEGWNALLMDFSTFPTGDFGHTEGTPDDSDLKSIRLEFTTALATDTPSVYWDHFISLDQGSPIPSGGALGTIFPYSASSYWSYRITYLDESGNESNSGTTSVTFDNTTGTSSYDEIILSDMPISSNPAVIKRRIYRTLAGGSEYLSLATVNNNTATTYTDTTPDSSLGTVTPPIAGATIYDNTPPPLAGICAVWKRTVFLAGDPINPTIMYFSRYDLPDAFPLLNTIEFDERVTGMFVTYVGIVVATETSFWRVISDNPDFVVDRTAEGMGCVGARAIGSARVAGWIIDRDGMRLYDLQQHIKVSEVIRDRVDGFNKENLEYTHSQHFKKNNCITWFTQDSGGEYSDIYTYQYLMDDTRKGWYSQIVPHPDANLNFLHTFEAEDDDGEPRAYACGDDGMLYEMFADDALNWTDASGAEYPLTCELQTAFLRLGAQESLAAREGTTGRELEGVSGRIRMYQIELRAKEMTQAAHTWQVTVDTADSPDPNATIRDSLTIDFEFPAGVSLLRLPVPNLTGGEYVRIKVENSELDKDLVLTGVKLLLHLSPGQFAVTGSPAGQV